MSINLFKKFANDDFANINVSDLDDIIDNVFDNKNNSNINVCVECGSTNFTEDYSRGIVVCTCGHVIREVYDFSFDRYQHDDECDTGRNNFAYNKLLPHSSLGTTINGNGKMKKLHIWNSMPYKDRSLIATFKQIHNVCTKYRISKQIEDDAKIVCFHISRKIHKFGKNIGKPIITRGDNRKGIIAGTLFIACRRNGETRSIKEIASYWNITDRDANKGLKSLINMLLDDDIIKNTGTSKVSDFVKRKCDELEIKKIYTDTAVTIALNIDKLNIASNHTSYSLAAACILLISDIYNIAHVTRRNLSETFNVSDVTIGKTYAQIEKYKNILIDNNKVNYIVQLMQRYNKRIITKEIWDKMTEFNVSTEKYVLIDNVNNHNAFVNYVNLTLIEINKLFTVANDNTFDFLMFIEQINNKLNNIDTAFEWFTFNKIHLNVTKYS